MVSDAADGDGDLFVVDESQNVGIGDATPQNELSVNGQMDLSAQAGITTDGGFWHDSTQEAFQSEVLSREPRSTNPCICLLRD